MNSSSSHLQSWQWFPSLLFSRLGCRVWLPCSETLGSFCNENDSGFESATMKMNLLFSKLCRVYSNLLKMPKVDLNSRRTAPMRKKNLSWYVYILHKTSTEKNLASWPCMGGKEMYWKLFCTWKIFVLIIEPIPSLKFFVGVAVFVACLSITGADKTESPCRVLEQTNIKCPLV